MRIHPVRNALLAVSLLTTNAAMAVELSFDAVYQQAERDQNSVKSFADIEPLVKAQDAAISEAVQKCYFINEKSAPGEVVLVMRLGTNGRVKEVWQKTDDEPSNCVKRIVVESLRFVPPHDNFYVSLEFKFSPSP